MTNDLTVGKPLPAILRMSLPIMAGNLFQQFYGMTDTIIVGRILHVMHTPAEIYPDAKRYIVIVLAGLIMILRNSIQGMGNPWVSTLNGILAALMMLCVYEFGVRRSLR